MQMHWGSDSSHGEAKCATMESLFSKKMQSDTAVCWQTVGCGHTSHASRSGDSEASESVSTWSSMDGSSMDVWTFTSTNGPRGRITTGLSHFEGAAPRNSGVTGLNPSAIFDNNFFWRDNAHKTHCR
jgi:hypothetical protein